MIHYLKEHWKYIINIVLFIIAIIIFSYILKISFIYASPIYFALLFYAIYKPCIAFLNQKGLSYKLSVGISITVITLILLGLFISIGTLLFFQVQNVSHNFPQWLAKIESIIESFIASTKSQFNDVPNTVTENAKEQIDTASGKIGEWIYGIFAALYVNVSTISKLIVQIIIGYILSIFLAFEWPKIKEFVSKNVPNEIKTFSISVFGDTVKGLWSFIKAQMILIICTFVIVWIALSILGVENALLLAFISGIFDIIPLLGVSTLFMPWIGYLLIIGETTLCIKLTILWLLVIGFRQVMEPRITGNSLGISPFTMLAGMFICGAIFGFIGFILAPVILVIIKSLWGKGYFHIWLFSKQKEKSRTGK